MAPEREQEASRGDPEAGVANPGAVRPPWVFLASIGLGLLLHILWPVRWLPASAAMPIGVIVMLIGGGLFVSSVRALRQAGTPVPGNRPTSAIVRTGPYAFSRNPIYLAFTLVQAGAAAWINSAAVLLMLAPALALMMLVVIPRGERYLQARFPAEYPAYKRAVRRWL